jgi:hypothetical protein
MSGPLSKTLGEFRGNNSFGRFVSTNSFAVLQLVARNAQGEVPYDRLSIFLLITLIVLLVGLRFNPAFHLTVTDS